MLFSLFSQNNVLLLHRKKITVTKKHRKMKKILWIVIVLLVGVLMYATAPAEEKHKEAMMKAVREYIDEEAANRGFKDNGITVSSSPAQGQSFKFTGDNIDDTYINLANPPHSLAVGSVQGFIDKMGYEVDYIHGEDSVRKLSEGNNTGILLPDVSKDSFFATISAEGVFPRKTFSMGEAFEKRFYFEAKRID